MVLFEVKVICNLNHEKMYIGSDVTINIFYLHFFKTLLAFSG